MAKTIADSPSILTTLLAAADKAMSSNLVNIAPKSSIIKTKEPSAQFVAEELTLGEFYVPGKTKIMETTEEQRMLLGLKAMNKKMRKEITSLRTKLKASEQVNIKKGFEAGHKRGYQEGLTKGGETKDAEIGILSKNLNIFMNSVEEQKNSVLKNAEKQTLEVVFATVEKLLAREVKTEKEIIIDVLKSVLEEIATLDKITIKVNPEDFAIADSSKQLWVPLNNSLENIAIQEDPRIEKGSCIVETSAGTVDAQFSTQIESIKKHLTESWERKYQE